MGWRTGEPDPGRAGSVEQRSTGTLHRWTSKILAIWQIDSSYAPGKALLAYQFTLKTLAILSVGRGKVMLFLTIFSVKISLATITLENVCYNMKHKGFHILCEYVCQRGQQGVKRCERVSGLDLVDLPVGSQVQVWLVQEPVDPFEWQPFSASFVNES
jgi:hypothetical protein